MSEDQKHLFLKYWKKEAPATRRVLERIPEGKSDYRPEPRSRSAREIAWLVVEEERILAEGLELGAIDWREKALPATMAEVLAAYDSRHDDVTARLEALEVGAYEAEVGFLVSGVEVMRHAGFDFAWEFLFDQVHHRGQLSTYLRPMGSTVPSIYGPSADETGS